MPGQVCAVTYFALFTDVVAAISDILVVPVGHEASGPCSIDPDDLIFHIVRSARNESKGEVQILVTPLVNILMTGYFTGAPAGAIVRAGGPAACVPIRAAEAERFGTARIAAISPRSMLPGNVGVHKDPVDPRAELVSRLAASRIAVSAMPGDEESAKDLLRFSRYTHREGTDEPTVAAVEEERLEPDRRFLR